MNCRQPHRIVSKDTDADEVIASLGLPFIIKPVHEGSSIGMSKVEKPEDFAEALAKATEHDAVVMAEKWINGREFTIVLLNGRPCQLSVWSHQKMSRFMIMKLNIIVMMCNMVFLAA